MADDVATIRSDLDLVTRSSGLGSRSSSYADILSGFNHRSTGLTVPINTDHQGITFFTRPKMNLSSDNCAASRILTLLNTDAEASLQRVIRVMMDPYRNLFAPNNRLTSPIWDSKQAFMPILSNLLISLVGWPDIAMDYYQSKEGRLRENYVIVDGTSETNSAFTLNGAFRNIGGDPITLLSIVWAKYVDMIHKGIMTPYMESIVTNRIDYQTRIFRFVLDPSRNYIQKWASAVGCVPVGIPSAAAINYSNDTPYSHDNAEQVALAFSCQGAEFYDPILFYEFNETVQMFNPAMGDELRESTYTKVPYQYLSLFNYEGYPRVNTTTQQLEWWVDSNALTSRVNDWSSMSSRASANRQPIPSNTAIS